MSWLLENLFWSTNKNDKITYENIRKIATSRGDDHTTGCLVDYAYFKNCYKMIGIDLSKQQALDTDPRAIQQINFTANLDRAGRSKRRGKRNCLRLFARNCKNFVNAIPLSDLIFISIKWHNTKV